MMKARNSVSQGGGLGREQLAEMVTSSSVSDQPFAWLTRMARNAKLLARRRIGRAGMSSSITAASDDRIQVVPTDAALAAEVRGVDLRRIDDGGFAAIHRAWLEHLVLLFRGQDLDDDHLTAFSRRFGDLDLAPIQENGRRFVEGHPEIYVVSNVIENGVAIGSLGAGEAVWHTDMSYLDDPPKASMLYAIEVPPSGGNTGFTNMYRAYEELPEPLKRRIAGRRLKHDGTYNSGGYVRHGITATDDPVASPGTYHPVVCVHPETGRQCLYLGRRRNAYIEGLPLAESEALLDELWHHATRAELSWYNTWCVGDLVLWDNRCTMHRRDPFDAASRRVMHRTQMKGGSRPSL
jgi:taurine dioxygenase